MHIYDLIFFAWQYHTSKMFFLHCNLLANLIITNLAQNKPAADSTINNQVTVPLLKLQNASQTLTSDVSTPRQWQNDDQSF